jgi:hypothetical protein
MGQDAADKARRWDAATQYCVPKKEVVTAIFPGVFGYRSTTLDGGTYWGTAGCTAAINEYYANGKKGPSPGSPHQVGAVGNYAGQLILILGAWAVLQSFRRKNSGYVDAERRMIWFWVGVVIICMLMMVGPYAPFYQFFYALPFASTIRNPGKFGHMMDWGIIVLGMYGAQSVCARLKAGPANISRDLAEQWAWWRKNSDAFEKNWFVGSVIAVGCALLGWLIYGASVQSLKDYLLYMDFDAASATTIASFSIHAVGWFVLFFTVTLGLVALVLSGYFAGKRATLGLALLAGILIVDLGRAHQPWINHWDAPYKYARNPVLEKLRERPWEYRVATLPFRTPPQLQLLDGIYRIEWAQHHFLSNDIQSLDLVQMPRPPVDWEPFERAMSGSPQLMVRRWQLTSTKYLLGPAGFVEPLNKEIDGGQSRFKPAMLFNLGLKPGVTQYGGGEDVTAVETPDGPYALIEFSGALPRAKLFANWQVHTNDESALRALVSPEFNPAQTVLVTDPNFTASASTNADAGSVTITNYSSKHITLRADATAPCVLLYNDRIAADWIARVDGVEQKILRCNYLMRGVQLTPGAHTVEFVYAPTTKFLYLSLLAIGVAFLLLGVLVFSNRRATA